MASTTTLYRTADWTNAESAHGPTLAEWLRHELSRRLDEEQTIAGVYGDSFYRFLKRLDEGRKVEGGDAFADFWTVDRWLTHIGLHPGMAPFGTWSKDNCRRQERRNAA